MMSPYDDGQGIGFLSLRCFVAEKRNRIPFGILFLPISLYMYVYVFVLRQRPHHQKNQETIYRVSKIQRNQRPDGGISALISASVHGDEACFEILHSLKAEEYEIKKSAPWGSASYRLFLLLVLVREFRKELERFLREDISFDPVIL